MEKDEPALAYQKFIDHQVLPETTKRPKSIETQKSVYFEIS